MRDNEVTFSTDNLGLEVKNNYSFNVYQKLNLNFRVLFLLIVNFLVFYETELAG